MTEHTKNNPSDPELRRLLNTARTIAIVGASSKPDRPSHEIMRTLLSAGFRVIPVNPGESTVLGQTAYPSLRDIPEPVDIVDVFRATAETPAIADDAVAIGAKALWLQKDLANDDARARAQAGGLTVVMDMCIGETVTRLGVAKPQAEPLGDAVEEAGRESFPASDSPAWSRMQPGPPPD